MPHVLPSRPQLPRCTPWCSCPQTQQVDGGKSRLLCAQRISWAFVSSDRKPGAWVHQATGFRDGERVTPLLFLVVRAWPAGPGDRIGMKVASCAHCALPPESPLQRTCPGWASGMGSGHGQLRGVRNRGWEFPWAATSVAAGTPVTFRPGSPSGEKGS